MPEPSYVTEPASTVKRSFSISGGAGGGDPGPGGKAKPSKTQAASSLPPPLSTSQVEGFFQPLRDEIEALPPPAPRPVPPATPGVNAFLSLLGAHLGASLLRDPGAADKVFGYLEQKEQERKAIEAQNYAQDLAFNQDKKMQLVQVRGKALEASLKQAIDANDTERAAKISENLQKLQAELQAQTVIPAQTEGQLQVEMEKGKQDRLTLAASFRAKLEEEAAKGQLKPLNSKEFLKSIDDINKNKELTTQEEGWFGPAIRAVFGGEKKVGKKDMLKAAFVSGIMGGDPGVKADAKRRLLMSVYSDLGWLGKKDVSKSLTANDMAKLQEKLAEYGVSIDMLKAIK